MRVATVRVRSGASPDDYIVINESDLSPDHEIWTGDDVVKLGLPDQSSAIPEIPENWATMHWKKQVKLAKSLGRQGEPSGDEAKAFIALKVNERDAQ